MHAKQRHGHCRGTPPRRDDQDPEQTRQRSVLSASTTVSVSPGTQTTPAGQILVQTGTQLIENPNLMQDLRLYDRLIPARARGRGLTFSTGCGISQASSLGLSGSSSQSVAPRLNLLEEITQASGLPVVPFQEEQKTNQSVGINGAGPATWPAATPETAVNLQSQAWPGSGTATGSGAPGLPLPQGSLEGVPIHGLSRFPLFYVFADFAMISHSF